MSPPRRQFLSLLASTPALAMHSSHATGSPPDDMLHVPWSRQAAIYQVNVREYTAEGTLKAAMAELRQWLARAPHDFPPSAYRVRFTNDHDFNSWNGTDAELYGDAYLPLAVLTFIEEA